MTNAWRKSSFSGLAECVEVRAKPAGGVDLRDSKDPDGTVLTCTRSEWRRFVDDIKAGGLDI